MEKGKLILAINPGSTSTKLALYRGTECLVVENLTHPIEEINKYEEVYYQKKMRETMIRQWLREKDIAEKELAAVVGRGGLLRSMPGGTYLVTEPMIADLKLGNGNHASNLGGIIAYDIAVPLNIPAFIVDPVSVDEFLQEARISGIPEITRTSLVHALNIKATTRKVCSKLDMDMFKSSFVVAHLGGGISIAPVKNGKILDVNNANMGGPFSPERTGTVPTGDLVRLCFSGDYTEKEVMKKINKQGGLLGYLGTNDGRAVAQRIEMGDKEAELVYRAMAYQIGKEIAAMATVLKGNVDRIIITGGLAYDKLLTGWIEEMVSFIAKVELHPGENEMEALAEGALRVIEGRETAKIYENEVFTDGKKFW